MDSEPKEDEIESVNPIEETLSVFLLAKRGSEWRLACKKIILVLGAHTRIQDKDQDINNKLPIQPNRNIIRKIYAKGITPITVLQSGIIQRAEEEGLINRIVIDQYENDLCSKVSRILHALSQKGILDLSKIMSFRSPGVDLEGGGFRKGFS